jgi:hypothetical protein
VGKEIRMSERFSGQACRGRIGTERECDCIVVLGSTVTLSNVSYVQTCVNESFNRVLMSGVATRESEETGTMGYDNCRVC